MKRILPVNYFKQYKFIAAIAIAIIFILNGSNSHCQSFDWAKKIGGDGSGAAYGNAVDQFGNVYVAGAFSGTLDFDPSDQIFNLTSAGEEDIYILKLDPSGNLIWAKSIGGTAYDDVYAIALDTAGNVHITGYFKETADFDPSDNIFEYTSFGNRDIYILKLDTDGNFIWAKQVGSESFEIAGSIAVNTFGDIIITGSFTNTMDFDPGVGEFNLTSNFSDVYILKLNANGIFIWVKQITGSNAKDAISIMTDFQGNIYVTGYFKETSDFDPSDQNFELTSFGSFDIYILKLNSFGDLVWAKQMGGLELDFGFAIDVSGNGDVYTTGYFDGIVDFDPSEAVFNLTAIDSTDFFVTKLNENGELVWAKSIGGTSSDIAYAIAVDDMGNVYTTGIFSGMVDFDPSENLYNLTSFGLDDFFVSKLDSQGNFISAINIGGTQNDYSTAISIDQENNIYVAGSFKDIVDFDPDNGVFNLIADSTTYDIFVLKLSPEIVGFSDISTPQSPITIYPNPNNGEFTIQSKSSGAFVIVNQMGQKIKTFDLNDSNQFSEKINGFSNGIYSVLGTNKNEDFRQKIIVEK